MPERNSIGDVPISIPLPSLALSLSFYFSHVSLKLMELPFKSVDEGLPVLHMCPVFAVIFAVLVPTFDVIDNHHELADDHLHDTEENADD